MLRKKALLAILTGICQLCISSNAFAQKAEKAPVVISKTNTAIYNYDARVSDMDLTNFYDLDKKVKDDFYQTITSSLKTVNGLTIKPMNFLAGKINYDHDGYPASRGKKAVATNSADNYINISVSIEGAGMKAPANEKNPDDCFLTQKVAVKISITVYDKAGEQIFDESTSAKSKDKIDFHYSIISIGNLKSKKIQPADTKILYDLLKEATDEMTGTKFPK